MFFAEHGERRGEHRRHPPAAACGEHRREHSRRHQQLRPGNDTRHRFDVHGVDGEDQSRGHGSHGRQPPLQHEDHQHADDAVEDRIDEVKPPGPAAAQPPVRGIGDDGRRAVQPATRGRRPVGLVERADGGAERVGRGVSHDDAAVVLDEAVAHRRQEQPHRHQEDEDQPHGTIASQTRARASNESATAASPRERAACAWKRR